MPFFKTTHNILVDHGEHFDSNWMDSDTLKLPPNPKWDYKRELQIEDVDIWEVVYEIDSVGVYAAWAPHAEYYLVKTPWSLIQQGQQPIWTFYGPKASDRVRAKLAEWGIVIPVQQNWVNDEDMWLY
jgi:hypothetical protein